MDLLARYPDSTLNVPIQLDAVRSLNLAVCTGIVLYEALRQVSFIPHKPINPHTHTRLTT